MRLNAGVIFSAGATVVRFINRTQTEARVARTRGQKSPGPVKRRVRRFTARTAHGHWLAHLPCYRGAASNAWSGNIGHVLAVDVRQLRQHLLFAEDAAGANGIRDHVLAEQPQCVGGNCCMTQVPGLRVYTGAIIVIRAKIAEAHDVFVQPCAQLAEYTV